MTMKWERWSERDYRVARASEWIRIDDLRPLRWNPGVYILADDSMWVEYIGSTGTVIEAVAGAYRQGKAPRARLVKALYTVSSSSAADLARELITYYDPPRN